MRYTVIRRGDDPWTRPASTSWQREQRHGRVVGDFADVRPAGMTRFVLLFLGAAVVAAMVVL